MAEIFLVSSYDLGGNAGHVIEAAFSTWKAADAYKLEYERRWQDKYPSSNLNGLFEIEVVDLDPSEPEWGVVAKAIRQG